MQKYPSSTEHNVHKSTSTHCSNRTEKSIGAQIGFKSLLAATMLVTAATLAACSGGGSLPTGLSQRMDQSGAVLDQREALNLINQFRASRGAPQISTSPTLTTQAQALADQYARTGETPSLPDGATIMRLSAGYANFAETFSGWRGSAADANAIATSSATQMGIAASYSANSTYGVYWVLLMSAPSTPANQ